MEPKKQSPLKALLPVRVFRLHGKLVAAAILGLLTALFMPGHWSAPTRVLAGWDFGVALYLVLTFAMMRRADVEHIRKRAGEADEGAAFILLLSIVATFASMVAIAFALGSAKQAPSNVAALDVMLAVTTIVLSWTFVHTIFSFHYAHEFYSERRDGVLGGLQFPRDDHPDYRDFLYFSLVIGMTSQVSDVAVCSKVIRRMVAIHGVLSFFFNLVVLALTVNMVANLI